VTTIIIGITLNDNLLFLLNKEQNIKKGK